MTREDVYAAFFALAAPIGPPTGSPVVGDGTFTTLSRRLLLVETFDPSSFPALFQQQVGEARAVYTQSGVQFYVFEVSWYVYAYQPNETDPMTPGLNALVQAVTAQISGEDGDDANTFFVGGQRINIILERVVTWEGVLGDRCVARLDFTLKPISI